MGLLFQLLAGRGQWSADACRTRRAAEETASSKGVERLVIDSRILRAVLPDASLLWTAFAVGLSFGTALGGV
jgi:hypothetical protein